MYESWARRHRWRTFSSGPVTGAEELFDSGGRPKDKQGNYYGGGYFRAHKDYTSRVPVYGNFKAQTGGTKYINYPVPAGTPDPGAIPAWWSRPAIQIYNQDIDGLGAKAWNRMRPDKPDLSILNSIYELREIPQILKPEILKYRNLKSWSNYFLAVNFGWIPLLNDVRSFVTSSLLMKQRIEQLIRDEGKPVRRKVNLGQDSYQVGGTASGRSYAAFQHGMVTSVYKSVPDYTDKFSQGIQTWAVGQFRYWLPPGPKDWRWRANQILRVYGAYPSPATVWNAIPWTWLVDWFTNVGDIVENLSSTVADRLAADYAFLMQRRYYEVRRDAIGTFNGLNDEPVQIMASTITLQRSKARTIIDPFGPSFNSGNLTNMQYAILGALGMSRLPSSSGRY